MKHCKVEHYVVKPNTPVYDWPYECGSGNNNTGCNCASTLQNLSTNITNINDKLTLLQNTISGMSSIDINDEQFINTIKDIVKQYFGILGTESNLYQIIEDKVNEIIGDIDLSDISVLKNDVLQLKQKLSRIDINKLLSYEDSISNINTNVTNLQNSFQTLEDAVSGIQQTLNTLSQNFADHINNTDIHVTAEDKSNWNNSTGLSSDYSFTVVDKELIIEKTTNA